MKKQDYVAAAICGLLLVAWMYFFAPKPAAPAPVSPVGGDSATLATVPAAANPIPQPVAQPAAPAAVVNGDLLPEFRGLAANDPLTLTAGSTGSQVEFVFRPDQGGIGAVVLEGFKGDGGKGQMRLGTPAQPMLAVATRKGPLACTPAKIEAQTADRLRLVRQAQDRSLVIEQDWRLDSRSPYLLSYQLTLRNVGSSALTVNDLTVNAGTMLPLDAPSGFFGAAGVDQRVDVKYAGKDSPKDIALAKVGDFPPEETAEWQVEWMAVQNKYFTSIVTPPERQVRGALLVSDPLPADDRGTYTGDLLAKDAPRVLSAQLPLPAQSLGPGESQTYTFQCYLGPKEFKSLRALLPGKEAIMQFDLFLFWNFGWMEWISRGILNSMLWLRHWGGSYGVAIILLTICLRILFFPLTHQSTVLSRRMQKVQPLAAKIREQYANDPEKMQRKTWDLYREHKINPMTGCLPVLLQIPVFFALFNVLRSAIELRQTGFLWAADLSHPDTVAAVLGFPINPLAVLMGITMVLQQKMMPTSADPAQQKIMTIMSAVFVIFLYSMPSGLTLYWTVNQVCSIVQYQITHWLLKDTEPAPSAKPQS